MTPDGPAHPLGCLLLGIGFTAGASAALWPAHGPWALAWGWALGCFFTLALLNATSGER